MSLLNGPATVSQTSPLPAGMIRRVPVVIPIHRIAGFVALCVVVLLTQRFVLPEPRWVLAIALTAAALSYAVLTLVVSRVLKNRPFLPEITDRFAELDILVFAVAIYATGGHQSWLFPLMVLRPADHLNTGVRRVLLYGHLSTLAYVFVLLWLTWVDGVNLPWATEFIKLVTLYGLNLYISLTARTFDRMRRQVRDSKRSAEKASQAKSEFLAAMSHELRTPLNAIIGYSELLQESDEHTTRQDMHKDLRRIEDAGRHLLGLVNQVLDLSKIESGKMELVVEPFQPAEVAREIVNLMAPSARQRHNQLVIDCESGTPIIESDAVKFRQSLLNLVSNACKFTENGSVTVRVAKDEPGWIAVSVRDTGIGINEGQVGKLFEPFVQADASITRKYGGTGLGLAISHKFCAMMGGNLTARSEAEGGSTFTMRIPVHPPK